MSAQGVLEIGAGRHRPLSVLITEIRLLLLVLSQLTSDKQGRYQLYATPKLHSGADGHPARKASPPRRTRPHFSRPIRALQLVEAQPMRREMARCIWHALELAGIRSRRGTLKDNYIVCGAHGWLFVCLVLPIERFDFTLKTVSTDVSPVTTLIWQFRSQVQNCKKKVGFTKCDSE